MKTTCVASEKFPKLQSYPMKRDTLPARTNTMTRETRAKEAKLKPVTLERKQIEATVHFGPKLLSREILESQFGVLFRPNIAKITRSSLCQTKWSASMTSLLIAAVVVVF